MICYPLIGDGTCPTNLRAWDVWPQISYPLKLISHTRKTWVGIGLPLDFVKWHYNPLKTHHVVSFNIPFHSLSFYYKISFLPINIHHEIHLTICIFPLLPLLFLPSLLLPTSNLLQLSWNKRKKKKKTILEHTIKIIPILDHVWVEKIHHMI